MHGTEKPGEIICSIDYKGHSYRTELWNIACSLFFLEDHKEIQLEIYRYVKWKYYSKLVGYHQYI
jgi:hypothetical protein